MQDRHSDAEEAYGEPIRLDPDLADAPYGLGDALRMQDRYHEAEESYKEAIRLKPTLASVHYGLADALRMHGRHHERRKLTGKRSASPGRFNAARKLHSASSATHLKPDIDRS